MVSWKNASVLSSRSSSVARFVAFPPTHSISCFCNGPGTSLKRSTRRGSIARCHLVAAVADFRPIPNLLMHFKSQPQYGRGATRFILCHLEGAFEHKEPVSLESTTIEHILPQTLTDEWLAELGVKGQEIHARLVDTFGNLPLTGYNSELGNLPFSEKKGRIRKTHIELNRWILDQPNWRENEIQIRADILLRQAREFWIGPVAVSGSLSN